MLVHLQRLWSGLFVVAMVFGLSIRRVQIMVPDLPSLALVNPKRLEAVANDFVNVLQGLLHHNIGGGGESVE